MTLSSKNRSAAPSTAGVLQTVRKRWLAGTAAVLIAMVAVACTTSPLGRSQLILFPANEMQQMGVAAYQEMKQQTPATRDARTDRYVQCISNHVLRALPGANPADWEITVFDDDQANAFALPGGKIGVYTGLLDVATNQHQVATVIGHEIAHVQANHSNERVSTAFVTQSGLQVAAIAAGGASAQKNQLFGLLGVGAQMGVILPFGRKQESEADLIGLDLMASAGFDPAESVTLWQNMSKAGGAKPPEFMSTHPSGERRIRDLSARMDQAKGLYAQAQRNGRRPDCAR